MGLVLLFFTIAVAVSFTCSILEAVLLSTPTSFVTMKEDEGATGAKLLKTLKENIDRPISAILCLNTIAHTIGASGVGWAATETWGEECFGLVSIVLTILILVFSEIIPKSIGARYWRSLACPTAFIIRGMVIITYPLVLISEWIMKIFSGSEQPVSVSRDEVSAMVKVGAEEGVLETEENRMIQNLLRLDSITAHEIMTPSVVVASADEQMTLKDFYLEKEFSTYSRIPVYEEDDNYITGYVLRQTVLEKLTEDKFSMRLADIVRPILKFEESTSVSEIWEMMLAKKEHISVIFDEYGCMRGIVTMEDVIETMLGYEIVDEKDTVADMQELAREKWQRMQEEDEEEWETETEQEATPAEEQQFENNKQ